MIDLETIRKIDGVSLKSRRNQNDNILIIESLLNALDAAYSARVKHTAVGGIAVKMTNRSGAATVKGYLVDASSDYDNSVKLTAIGVPDCIGVFLDSGVADGEDAWVVVAGIAEVYYFASATRGHMARIGLASDTGEVVGQALSEEVPTSPFATDKHFAEIGHVMESRTGAGLAKTVLHFN